MNLACVEVLEFKTWKEMKNCKRNLRINPVFFLILLMLAGTISVWNPGEGSTSKNNILLITIDTLRPDRLLPV
jgi:hypothetical protein